MAEIAGVMEFISIYFNRRCEGETAVAKVVPHLLAEKQKQRHVCCDLQEEVQIDPQFLESCNK